MADFDKMNIDAVPYHVKDTTARQQIADEITAREHADTQLQQAITAEQNAREQAITAQTASKYLWLTLFPDCSICPLRGTGPAIQVLT